MHLVNSLIFLTAIFGGCLQDYAIVTGKTETVYETVEVPVYVQEEVIVKVDSGEPDPEVWVDSFMQVNTVDGVDILWVIDTSGSMMSYQGQLLAGIEHMMNALPDAGWRLVMMSTDPDEVVLENQFPLVPGDTITDAEDMYALINTGPDEKGFDSVMSYIQTNPYAMTWMRPEAALLVVFVSDEDDQSNDFAGANEFVNWYTALRYGNVFLASIVTQEPEDSVCDSWRSGSQAGKTYMEATIMLSGTIVDICADDWTPGVTDATTQIQPRDSIQLTHTPDSATIRVFIDGQQYYDWVYISSSNTVQFLTLPPGGALVEVGYIIE